MSKEKVNEGHAVLDFIQVYGWAFLVILVLLGVLGYFGVFDFSMFTSTAQEQHVKTIRGYEESFECVAWGDINRDNLNSYCGVGCMPSVDEFDVLRLSKMDGSSSKDYDCTRWLVFKDKPAEEINEAPLFCDNGECEVEQ